MTQSIILVSAAKLSKSPANVRKSSEPTADAQLEANIAARGVIQNLIGVPVARKKGHYRITAGGRRLDRVHALIEKGVLPPDYEVPVMVVADRGDIIEISLSENFFKLDMNPADACRAFQDIIDTEGKTIADVAKRFGLTERFVQGRLRLAGLAEPVFEALRDGSITLDVAMAYASTTDTARQASVFDHLSQAHYRASTHEVRRQLAQGAYKGNDPKALLVGRDAYVAAGGRIDSDLFSDQDSESWIDGALLDTLAEVRLTAAAEEIRTRDGFADIRIIAATHPSYSETYGLRRLDGEAAPMSAQQIERREIIESEIDAIEAAADPDEGMSEDQNARIEALEEELGQIVDRPALLTDEQKASALAYLVIGPDGQPQLHEQLFVAPAEDQNEGDDENEGEGDGDGDGQDIRADEDQPTEPAKPAISQRLADELAMMKTELLAVHVASDPHFALDLATFFMADAATRRFGTADLPTDLRATVPSPRVHGFASGMPAAVSWAGIDAGLDRSWTEHETATERYDAFCALEEPARAAWLGWTIARTLQAIPEGRTGSALLNHLGAKLDIDVAAWWRPTATCFFDRITKPAILALFDEVGGNELRQRYGAAKKHDLAVSAEKLFAGDVIVEAEVKARALAWLPDAMRFAPRPVAPQEDPAAGPEDRGSAPDEVAVPVTDQPVDQAA
jgi:ParB family chromosome partitioning protein